MAKKEMSPAKGMRKYIDAMGCSGVSSTMAWGNWLKKNREYPLASKDPNKQLLVAAAVKCDNTDADLDEAEAAALTRSKALVEAGADIICLDSFQGDSLLQEKVLKELKNAYPNVDVIAGNVVTCRQAKALLDAGADALRVGMSAEIGRAHV